LLIGCKSAYPADTAGRSLIVKGIKYIF